MSRYTIRKDSEDWRRRWLLYCSACKVDVPCASWDVAVLMMGTPHRDHEYAARSRHGTHATVVSVLHPMTGEEVSSVQVWRARNLFFRLPEFEGASL